MINKTEGKNYPVEGEEPAIFNLKVHQRVVFANVELLRCTEALGVMEDIASEIFDDQKELEALEFQLLQEASKVKKEKKKCKALKRAIQAVEDEKQENLEAQDKLLRNIDANIRKNCNLAKKNKMGNTKLV